MSSVPEGSDSEVARARRNVSVSRMAFAGEVEKVCGITNRFAHQELSKTTSRP